MSDYQRFVASEDILLKTFLEKRVSGRALKKLKYQGGIKVNGIARTVRYLLRQGDVVELFYPSEKARATIIPWYFPLHVLYEDDYLMVVRKPAGMPSVPNGHYPNYTLTNVIMGYYEMAHIDSTVHLVSRLDKDTSGIILVAKTRRMHALLNQNFERRYRLWVTGKMIGEGTIDAPIARGPESIKRFVSAEGKRAVTHYQVLESGEKQSLVEAVLETGRTHQIRVHFAHLGHPLLGDKLYGKAHPDFNGQALHSFYLSFVHPVSGQLMTFEDLPELYRQSHFQY